MLLDGNVVNTTRWPALRLSTLLAWSLELRFRLRGARPGGWCGRLTAPARARTILGHARCRDGGGSAYLLNLALTIAGQVCQSRDRDGY